MKEEETDKVGQIKGQTWVPPISGRISLKIRHSNLVSLFLHQLGICCDNLKGLCCIITLHYWAFCNGQCYVSPAMWTLSGTPIFGVIKQIVLTKTFPQYFIISDSILREKSKFSFETGSSLNLYPDTCARCSLQKEMRRGEWAGERLSSHSIWAWVTQWARSRHTVLTLGSAKLNSTKVGRTLMEHLAMGTPNETLRMPVAKKANSEGIHTCIDLPLCQAGSVRRAG